MITCAHWKNHVSFQPHTTRSIHSQHSLNVSVSDKRFDTEKQRNLSVSIQTPLEQHKVSILKGCLFFKRVAGTDHCVLIMELSLFLVS